MQVISKGSFGLITSPVMSNDTPILRSLTQFTKSVLQYIQPPGILIILNSEESDFSKKNYQIMQ